MFKKLPKAVAVLYWRNPATTGTGWNYQCAYAADSMHEAAGLAEGTRKTMMQSLEFRILCGNYTHEVEPPPPPILKLIGI